MRREVRRKIEMAVRAWEFNQAHPSTGPSFIARLGALEQGLTRARTLDKQERDGRQDEASTASHRRELRRTIQTQLLPHLVRVGKLAKDPVVAGKFRVRSPDATHTSLLISTQTMVALAEANQPEFLANGLDEALFGELQDRLAEFEGTLVRSRAARVEHIRAGVGLEVVGEELVRIVGQLDGLNRFRFRGNPDLKGAWDAVRRIGPRNGSKPEPPAGAAPPGGGGLAPAA